MSGALVTPLSNVGEQDLSEKLCLANGPFVRSKRPEAGFCLQQKCRRWSRHVWSLPWEWCLHSEVACFALLMGLLSRTRREVGISLRGLPTTTTTTTTTTTVQFTYKTTTHLSSYMVLFYCSSPFSILQINNLLYQRGAFYIENFLKKKQLWLIAAYLGGEDSVWCSLIPPAGELNSLLCLQMESVMTFAFWKLCILGRRKLC